MYEKDLVVLEGLKKEKYGDSIDGHDVPILHKLYEPYTVAKLAMDMAARWGTVAALPDGEDASGRQKLRMQSPEELAEAACATAAALWRQFEERGWFFANPLPVPRKSKETEEA